MDGSCLCVKSHGAPAKAPVQSGFQGCWRATLPKQDESICTPQIGLNRRVFPGCSSMSHLLTCRKFVGVVCATLLVASVALAEQNSTNEFVSGRWGNLPLVFESNL